MCLSLQVWRKPLPVVLKEKIMDPIGASTTGGERVRCVILCKYGGVMTQSVVAVVILEVEFFISARDRSFWSVFLEREMEKPTITI
jgi:hypothetical protein